MTTFVLARGVPRLLVLDPGLRRAAPARSPDAHGGPAVRPSRPRPGRRRRGRAGCRRPLRRGRGAGRALAGRARGHRGGRRTPGRWAGVRRRCGPGARGEHGRPGRGGRRPRRPVGRRRPDLPAGSHVRVLRDRSAEVALPGLRAGRRQGVHRPAAPATVHVARGLPWRRLPGDPDPVDRLRRGPDGERVVVAEGGPSGCAHTREKDPHRGPVAALDREKDPNRSPVAALHPE